MSVRAALQALADGMALEAAVIDAAFAELMDGGASPAQIGALLFGLKLRGESPREIGAAARQMRTRMTPVAIDRPQEALDIVGTGGDGARLFNVSTAAALVCAAAGARVAKHGNRSVSSASGAADVLEAAGVRLELSAVAASALLRDVGFVFLYAPSFHAATRHVAGPRRELGVRTVFNLLGPLTNPAGVGRHLIGVYDPRWLEAVAQTLVELGSQRLWVVHSDDGLDELSPAACSSVIEFDGSALRRLRIDPAAHGLGLSDLSALKVDNAAQSLAMLRSVLAGEPHPAANAVLLNAAAGLLNAALVGDLAEGVARARSVLASGAALDLLGLYARLSAHTAA